MNLKVHISLIEKLETISVVFLLVVAEILSLPPTIRSLINLASYIIVALLILRQTQRVAYVFTRDISLLLLIGMACASIFWSANITDTQDSIRALIRSTMLGTYIATRYTPKEQIRLVTYAVGISIVLSTILAIVFPVYGTGITNGVFVWKGIYGHKQYLARFMAIGFSVFLITLFGKKSNKLINFIGLGATLALIILSTSKTGLLMVLFLLLSLPLYYIAQQKYKFRTILLIFSTILIALVSFIISANLEFIVVDLMGKNLEFNGRLPIWTLAIQKGLEQPFLGYGYAGFWSSEEATRILSSIWGGVDAIHAHSGFVDLFLQLGFVGILLMLLNLLGIPRHGT